MNIEKTKECIKVMQAFVDGEQIEHIGGMFGEWTLCKTPEWNFGDFQYRIKPQPKFVPLTQDDIPCYSCWLRRKGSTVAQLVVEVAEFGVETKEGFFYYTELFENKWEYSTDRRSWMPFGYNKTI